MSSLDVFINTILDIHDGKQSVTLTNVVGIVVKLMQSVAQFDNLSGTEKKAVVMSSIMSIVERIADEEDEHELKYNIFLEEVLTSLVPPLIDTLVKVDANHISINEQTHTFVKNCFSCCR